MTFATNVILWCIVVSFYVFQILNKILKPQALVLTLSPPLSYHIVLSIILFIVFVVTHI
jgi:hypothetical protein